MRKCSCMEGTFCRTVAYGKFKRGLSRHFIEDGLVYSIMWLSCYLSDNFSSDCRKCSNNERLAMSLRKGSNLEVLGFNPFFRGNCFLDQLKFCRIVTVSAQVAREERQTRNFLFPVMNLKRNERCDLKVAVCERWRCCNEGA